MRTLKVLIAVAAMMVGLLPATPGFAWPHAPPEDPHTTCVVDGSVTLRDGVSTTLNNDHYTFVDTALECDSLPTAPKDYTGVYSVEAEGDTTGYDHDNLEDDNGDPLIGGENCAQGGSAVERDSNGKVLEYHTGIITAERDRDGFTITGAGPNNEGVHFARLGEVVLADGPLTDEDGDEGYFHAELLFQPTEGDCVDTPATQADLTGVAVIAEGHGHVCYEYGDTSNDPHCTL